MMTDLSTNDVVKALGADTCTVTEIAQRLRVEPTSEVLWSTLTLATGAGLLDHDPYAVRRPDRSIVGAYRTAAA